MSWSYRRRVKLIPGVYLNFSRSGISTSIGVKGASLTFSKQGTYLNTGIPGTGIYNRRKISSEGSSQEIDIMEPAIEISVENNMITVEPEQVVSQDMKGIKETIINAHQQREDLLKEIHKVKRVKLFTIIKLIAGYIFIIGLVSTKIRKSILRDIDTQKQAIQELITQRENSYVNLDIEFDEDIKLKYDGVAYSFQKLMNCEKIWDITNEKYQNRVKTRSAASTLETKKEVRFESKTFEDIKSKAPAFFFKNSIGPDMYFYPHFIVLQGNGRGFGIVSFKELNFEFSSIRFIETERVPSDSKIIDKTWAKVNKNGSPDKRFKSNYQIPIVRYGSFRLTSESGLNEEFEFSNYEVSETFALLFKEYLGTINKLH